MSVDNLADSAWQHFSSVSDLEAIVRPSIPILYFGDMDAYERSPYKVITVALNPSGVEFPAVQPFMRFPKALLGTADSPQRPEASQYLGALNEYFRISPYNSWFRCLEPVLNGMQASYYGHETSAALHTDLFSPLATDPTWSKLDHQSRSVLEVEGVAIWHQLVELLNPDAIVISIARGRLNEIHWIAEEYWEPLIELPPTERRTRLYTAQIQKIVLPSGKNSSVLFGPAAQQPFATLTNVEKRLIGTTFRESDQPAPRNVKATESI